MQNDAAAQSMSKNIDTIDNLLGTLSSDMEKMGVRTTAKGHCASCGKCIAGKVRQRDRPRLAFGLVRKGGTGV